MSPRRAGEQGTSLMEVLVAITLFSLVASGAAALAANSYRATANNRLSTTAQMLAQEQLESVRGLDYAAIEASNRNVTVNGHLYHVDTEVLPDSPADGMSEITVEITWESPIGNRSYEIQTIFTAIR